MAQPKKLNYFENPQFGTPLSAYFEQTIIIKKFLQQIHSVLEKRLNTVGMLYFLFKVYSKPNSFFSDQSVMTQPKAKLLRESTVWNTIECLLRTNNNNNKKVLAANPFHSGEKA
ncbi:hypothetical protein CEXT_74011 [Caerostris extrusa]|uniref:Uncharacterized protein n=1 Tax=Caerostris extrusa TaxID=172846 RepID=A0AAV4VGY0_CAEEX|nr:hypothetical protein CEXT_74011 [Caerostris extrusa]